ncbi:MAG: DnaJ domain-containing protein [SAR324 cluster bacterium]|nr:DnaJ domain-containing protein [SAR324 cluster bacterium]
MDNYYTLFEVPPSADVTLIRSAFRKKAKSCHPDLFQQLPAEERQSRQKEFVRLTQAYEILADPQKRLIFDRELAKSATKARQQHDQKNRRSSSFSSSSSSFKQKNKFSANPKESSTSEPEDSLEDLLKDVEEMLGKFGLNFKDPLEMLVEWARNIFQEITEIANDQTDNNKSYRQQNKNAQTASTYKEPLDNLEAELDRLKREINAGSKAAASAQANYTENEIEEELRSIKKKYKL